MSIGWIVTGAALSWLGIRYVTTREATPRRGRKRQATIVREGNVLWLRRK